MARYNADTLDSLLPPEEGTELLARAKELFAELDTLDEQARMDAVNALRLLLHEHSPMKDEPVDCVLWVDADLVEGNSYNPNTVAPPEMKLLELSITVDGFTQPIVAWPVERDGQAGYEVVDGFHRHKIGKDKKARKRLGGRLPITVIRAGRTDLADRQASTIRHNRARGVHAVDPMSDIVIELTRLGKTDAWIGQHLGMGPDEVRRLRQITGLAENFADQEYSEAWEAAGQDAWAPRVGPGDDF